MRPHTCRHCNMKMSKPTPIEAAHGLHTECLAPFQMLAESRVQAAMRACDATPEAFDRTRNGRFDRIMVHERMRARVFLYLRERCDMSYPEIAQATGGTTHTTMIAAVRKLKAQLAAHTNKVSQPGLHSERNAPIFPSADRPASGCTGAGTTLLEASTK